MVVLVVVVLVVLVKVGICVERTCTIAWVPTTCPLLNCWSACWPAAGWKELLWRYASQLAARCGCCSALDIVHDVGQPRSTSSSLPRPMCANHESRHCAIGSCVARSHRSVATNAHVLHISDRLPATFAAWHIPEKKKTWQQLRTSNWAQRKRQVP